MPKKLLFLLCICNLQILFAQTDSWTRKADFGGAARNQPVSFSIGTKGYIGGGISCGPNPTFYQDFWEWDQATNTWTQKADLGGGGRLAAVGFSIGRKGYIGTGDGGNVTFKRDFWEWDQATNMWTQKADFGGTARSNATGFSIGTKGYIGTGSDGTVRKDFWEWDQATNIWTQKADFGGTARQRSVGFSIGNKGYIGTGTEGGFAAQQDFWEWGQATNTWTQKANYGGGNRHFATGFSIGNKGYIGTGDDAADNPQKDFWQWDQAINTWTKKVDFGGGIRAAATGFSIGTKGYIGTGVNNVNCFQDFWEYNPNLCSDNPIIVTIPNASVLGSGVDPNTVYIGYAPASTITLKAIVSGGNGSYSYHWSNGGTTASIQVSPKSPTLFIVTVTDGNGCKQTASKLVKVKNIRCDEDRVLICSHQNENDHEEFQTKCVDPEDVPSHLAHGAHLGPCKNLPEQEENNSTSNNEMRSFQNSGMDISKPIKLIIKVAPNPSNSQFSLLVNGATGKGKIHLRIVNLYGSTLEIRTANAGETIRLEYAYRPGVYFVEAIQGDKKVVLKLIKMQ